MYIITVYITIISNSGGRLCTLIDVPCRLSMLSTFSTFAKVLFEDKSPRAEGAKTDPPPGHTYEGTQTTAWVIAYILIIVIVSITTNNVNSYHKYW